MKKARRGQRQHQEETVKTGGSDGGKKGPNITAEGRTGEIRREEEARGPNVRVALSQPTCLDKHAQAVCASYRSFSTHDEPGKTRRVHA